MLILIFFFKFQNPQFKLCMMSLALFTICLISQMHGSEAVGGQCKTSERSVPGKALKGHTFKEFAVRAIVECQNTCERDPRCASYNFYIPGKVCELNSHTKEEKPDHFVTDELRFYMKREGMNYVKLSTPNTLSVGSFDSPYEFVQLAGLILSAILPDWVFTRFCEIRNSKRNQLDYSWADIYVVSSISKESRPCILRIDGVLD